MKTNSIPTENYIARRKKLASKAGVDCVIISAHTNVQKSYDESFPFVQDKNFLYLTGINEPGWVLVIDVAHESEYLIQPYRDPRHAQFDGDIDTHYAQEVSGISTIYPDKTGWKNLKSSQYVKIGLIKPSPRYIAVYEMVTNPARKMLQEKVKRALPLAEIVNISTLLAGLRKVKDADEIQAIQTAIEYTKQVLDPVVSNITDFNYEYEIEAEIAYAIRKLNAIEGYKSIVSAGKNTTQLHYHDYNKKIAGGDMILLDVGVMKDFYSADITRTLPFGITFSQRQQDVYDAVLDTQNYAFSLLGPGVIPREYEAKVETYIGEHMMQLGLIKKATHETIREYFPSWTSHYLGLDIHDPASVDEPLEPGVVMTVEPGIYIPNETIGVRIEDDIVITDSGIDNLSINIEKVQ